MPHPAILAAIHQAWNEGCPVASHPEPILDIWDRHHRRLPADRSAAIAYLTKKLINALEKDPTLVGPLKVDYRYLAEKMLATMDAPTKEG